MGLLFDLFVSGIIEFARIDSMYIHYIIFLSRTCWEIWHHGVHCLGGGNVAIPASMEPTWFE